MKKYIACLLVVSLLLSISVSAAGTDIYTLDDDVSLMSLSAADSGVSVLSFGDTEAAQLDSIEEKVVQILSLLDGDYTISDLYSVVSWIEDPLLSDGDGTYYVEEIMNNTGSLAGALVTANGTLSDIYDALVNSREVSYLETIEEDLVEIWDFLDSESQYSSLLDVLAAADDPTITALNNIYLRLAVSSGDFLNSNGAVASLGGATPITNILRLGLLGLAANMRNSSGAFLNQDGVEGTISGATSFTSLMRYGFLGLGSLLRSEAGSAYLALDGTQSSLAGSSGVGMLLRNGFLGLRSTIAGSETDNVYSGTITSNENVESSFSATGLGPMLNKWFDAVQLDTGRLAYMFASPADIQAKKESVTA